MNGPPLNLPGSAYTTVADWRGFGPVEWRGVWYNQKADEFKRMIDLPRQVAVPLELCLFIHPDEPDRVELEQHGWQLVSPTRHAVTPDAYRDYITVPRRSLLPSNKAMPLDEPAGLVTAARVISLRVAR